MADEIKTEGPRSLAVLMQGIRDDEDGTTLNEEASEKFHEFMKALRAESIARDAKVSGTFTITFGVAVKKGNATVSVDINAKTPRKKPVEVELWVTRGGNLSVEAPRQEKLPFGVVEGGAVNETNGNAAPKAAKEV